MKCRATRDGLLGTAYVHEGELFLADKCPSWAEPAEPVKQKAKAPKGGAQEPKEPAPKGGAQEPKEPAPDAGVSEENGGN